MIKPIWKTVILSMVLLAISVNNLHSQCSIDGQVDIPDLTPVSADIEITGAVNNDLATSQGVCGISLEFEHEHIGDLTIELTSPSGQTVTLLGPTGSFGNTTFTDWNVLFTPCSLVPSPDAGFLGTWNNNQDWGLLGDYSGSYHPYLGCLEDFNLGSVNGIWSVNVVDNTQFDLGKLLNATIFFCEQEGLSCNTCEAYAGEFLESNISVCVESANDISLLPSFPNGEPSAEYDFYYVVRQGEAIQSISSTLDMSSLPVGEYEVCGLSLVNSAMDQLDALSSLTYTELVQQIEGATPTICGDLNENCTLINLTNALDELDLNVTICEGSTYELGGNSYSLADSYVVTIDNPGGCDTVYNLTLTTVVLESITSAANTVISCSANELILNGNSSVTSSSSIYEWTTTGGGFVGATDQANVTVNQAGTYTLNIIDGECESSSSILISLNDDVPELMLIGGTITCANPTVDIDLESDVTLVSTSWTGPNGFMSGMEDVTVDEAGIYSVTVEAENGCITSKSITINEAGEIPVLQLSADNISCSIPQVPIQVNASSNSLTYSWTGPGGFVFLEKNPIVFEPGLYTVVATDPFGCEASFSIEIMGSSDILDYVLNYEDIRCASSNNAISLEINDPDAIIVWTLPNATTQTGPVILTQQIGNFTVSINSNGCVASEMFTINTDYDHLPVLDITQNAVLDCANPSVILSASVTENEANIDYVEWRYLPLNLVVGSDLQIEVTLSGGYALFVYNTEGCAIRYNYTLQIDANLPIASIQRQNLTCINPISSLVASSAQNLDYSWTGPNSFASGDSALMNLEDGLYYLTVTDVNGCSREYGTVLNTDTIPPPLNLMATGMIDCDTDTSYLSPGFPDISGISWTSTTGLSSSDLTFAVADAGTYYLEAIINRNGCPAFDTIEVLEDFSVPDIDVEDQSFNCGQSSLFLEANSTTTGVTYLWSGPSGFSSTFKNPIITDAGTYTLTVMKQNGCFVSETIEITQNNTLPDVDASFSNDLDCVFTQSSIIGTSSDSDVSFEWSGPNEFVSGQPVVTIEVAGDYTFFVTGMNGCKDSITINVPFTGAYPEFAALGDTLFCGEATNTIDVDATTLGVSYEWNGPNSFNSGDQMNTVVDSGMYIVTGVGQNNCITIDTAFVVFDNQAAVVELGIEIDTLTCDTLSQELTIMTDKAFTMTSWTGPNGFMSEDQDITVVDGGAYQFIGISANNCEVVFDIDVEQDIDIPVISLDAQDLSCDTTKALITLTNDDLNATYLWSGPNFYVSDVQSTIVEEEGFYEVTVTGGNGCELVETIEIFADFEEPVITVEDDTLPCDGTAIPLFLETETTNVTFQWVGPNGFDSTSQNPLTNVPGVYFVEVKGVNGCSKNEIVEIKDIPVFPKYDLNFSNSITCETPTATITASDVSDDKSFMWTTPDGEEILEESFTNENSGIYYFQIEGVSGCIVNDSLEIPLDTLYPTIEITQTGILLCDVNELSLSGDGSSVGVEFDYDWSTEDGNVVFGANSLNPVIEGPGTYRLFILNESNGCGFFEELTIEESESTLASIDLNLDKQTCTGIEDGIIEVVNVEGGVAPFRYALAGTSFSQLNSFENLSSGEYVLSVKDTFGCVLDTLINLGTDKDVSVDLGNDYDIALGETVNLVAAPTGIPTNQIDSLAWTPTTVIDCIGCLEFEFVPEANMLVTVFIKDNDGCIASDQVIIRVDESINLYVPNIFTPNNDGINDIWSISESTNIELINYFNIYDRWGDRVFFDENFIPGQGQTWDGRHNGTAVQQGAFVYIAEVVMVNGRKRIIKGNITVMR